MATLGFPSNTADYVDINVGNERTNVFVGVHEMKYPASTFKDLSVLIDPDETDPQKIPKTIIYIDDVNEVTLAVIALYSWLHPSLQDLGVVMPIHAWMPAWYRSDAMAKFASGEVRILVCTEAAGMGCDISDIKRVVQFGLCRSVDAFMQRIGRCWRASGGTGEGWLFIEGWAWNGKGGATGETTRKAADPLLIGLVNVHGCRRQYLNRIYCNPPSGKSQFASTILQLTLLTNQTSAEHAPEARDCCDNCNPDAPPRFVYRTFQTVPGATRAAAVSGELDPRVLACLVSWRKAIFPTIFGPFSLFGATALIGDGELERISRCAPLPSIEQLRRYLIKWPRVDSLLESMWKALSDNGFTITQPPPETAQPSNPSHPTPSASTSRKTRRAPKSRPQNKGLRESQGDAASANVVLRPALPAPPTPSPNWGSFVREWMPNRERDYEINYNTSLDDFRRFFAAQAAARLQAEPDTKHPRSPSPLASSSKRQRLENITPGQAPAHTTPSLSLAVFDSRELQPNSPHKHLVSQQQARPVARLIVRSQRIPANPTPTNIHPSHTTRLVELRHPLPRRLPLPSQTIRTHARSSTTLGPERPPRPPPSTELALAAYSSIRILIAQDIQSTTEAVTVDSV